MEEILMATKEANRPLLAKYINQYTARNTCDYFIHKDLNGFLKRELDFYIKNEVMNLDDIENAEAPAVESYLSKLKVLRKIATKLIKFMSQLEDFQKKLWLKKKFVTETNYCITLDRVPKALYPEIAANDAQREEWIKLFAIDEIEATDGDLLNGGAPGYSAPLSVEFLNANDNFVKELEQFLLELGVEFCFLVRQKRITVDNEDFYLDLLFYHRDLKRLVAIELKLGDFKPEHKGQMELHLRWLDKHERRPGEEPPMGLILCAGKKEERIELLELGRSGIHVAEYLLALPSKEVLRDKLHKAIEYARKRLENQLGEKQ